MVRLTQQEIADLTTRVPTPDSFPRDNESAFQLPTLLPNTMYAYNAYLNVKNHYPEPVALSPQSTIPLIDLCSTDEEDEIEPISSVPLMRNDNGQLVLADDKYQEQNKNMVEDIEPLFCDIARGPNTAVYPVIETTYETHAQIGRSSSCFDEGTFTMQYPSDPSVRLKESVPQGLQRNICTRSPLSISPTPAFTHEAKHNTYSSALHCNSAESQDWTSCKRKGRMQTKNFNMISASDETFNSDGVEEAHTPFLQDDPAECLKLYSSHVRLIRTKIDSKTKTQLSVPSCASASLTIDHTDNGKSNSKLSFPCRNEKTKVAVRGTASEAPTFISEVDVEPITGSSESHHPVSSLNHVKERTVPQVCSASSEESIHHNVEDACLSLCEEKGKHEMSLLRMAPNKSPVSTYGESTSPDCETMNTTVSHQSVSPRPRRRVQYQRKVSSNTPYSSSLVQTLHTDGSGASYVSLQSNLADSVKMHRSKKSVPLRKAQPEAKVVITPVPATAFTISQDRDGTAFAPLNCDTTVDPKLEHLNRSLPHRRDRTRFAGKKASEEHQHVEDLDSVVPVRKKPNLRVNKETVPQLESKTQVSAINRTFSLLYSCPLVSFFGC
jgi:hypothetical protein